MTTALKHELLSFKEKISVRIEKATEEQEPFAVECDGEQISVTEMCIRDSSYIFPKTESRLKVVPLDIYITLVVVLMKLERKGSIFFLLWEVHMSRARFCNALFLGD